MPGLRGPDGLTAGPSRDGLVYVRDLKDSFDLYARISELRSASIVLDPLPDVQVDSAASRPLTLDARTETAGKAPRILTGKLSPLPAKVRVRVHDTGGERRFGYTAGGTVDSLLLTGSGIPLLGRATAFQVKASGVPAGAEVRFAKDGVITGTMTAPVGDLTLRALDKAGTLVALPDAQSDGVMYENRHGRFAAMVRIRDLTSFRISPDAKHAAVAVDSLSKHPFTADVRLDLHPGLNLGGHANTQNSKPDRAVSARIDKLSRHMSLGLSDLGPAKGSRIDYAADTPIKDVRVTADGYRLAPKGDYAALRLQDVPTQLSVVVDPVGTVTATSPGEPIGVVEVMLTDGPGTTIMPPAAQDGVRYSDTKKGWGVGARVSRLQAVTVGTKPGAIVHVDSLAAKPFEADLTFADGDRVTGAISALARNTRVSLTPTATGQRADYSADGPIASLRLVGYGIFDLPRGPQVLLEAKDIPSKLRVDLGAAGSVAGTAPDGVGSIQVIATDDVGKPYAPWGEPLLQNEHGFMLHDVPKERYFLGVRVFGLRSFELPATESIVVKADADKRPLTADLRMPFAEPKAGETTPAEPLVNNSGIPYEYYRMRLEQTQPHTRITLDLADRGAESVSNVTYEADAAGPGFGMTSNAGGHQLTTTSVTPMPKQLHACISSYRWCSTSDGFIINKNLGGQPDGPFKGQVPNIGGAFMLAASSPVTLDFIDCWKSAGSCVKKPGLDADYDGVQLRGFTFQKVALDMSGIKYDAAAISNGLKGHLWVDTDEYPASGTFVMRDPGGDVESINITLPAKFRTQDRLAVFKADRPVLEDVAENSYWGDGGVDCDTGIGLDGWFASEQAIQVYRKALCHYGHPPVPK